MGIDYEIGGGGSGLADVVDDTTPQLGGDLDVNGNAIVSASNGDIDITPDGTGNVSLGTLVFNGDQTVGAGQDNYVLTYDNGTGLINLEAVSAGLGGSTGATDNAILRADGTGGATAQSSAVTIDDLGNVQLDTTNPYIYGDTANQYVRLDTGAVRLNNGSSNYVELNGELKLRGSGNEVAVGNGNFRLADNHIVMNEKTAPAGGANQAIIFAQDNGAGKTQLMVIFGSGSAQQIAIEP